MPTEKRHECLKIERKVTRMVTKISEIHSDFYFTQPDNVVMFDKILSQTAKVVYCNLLSHVKKVINTCKVFIAGH